MIELERLSHLTDLSCRLCCAERHEPLIRRIETMKLMRALAVVLLLAYSGAMLGCGGGGADVKQSTTTTTLGKELQDLDDAYKKGLLSEKEYKDARKNLMKKYND
jgi:hypothetical protein